MRRCGFITRELWSALLLLSTTACGEELSRHAVRLNEVVSNNEGVFVDERGETDDYIEIYNAGSDTIQLGGYVIADESAEYVFPEIGLAKGAVLVLWADDSPEQGRFHLPFKISSEGERLSLLRPDRVEIEQLDVPALAEHHAFERLPDGVGQFTDCGWATPARLNGDRCGPPEPESSGPGEEFLPYAFPEPWPDPAVPLAITEIALDGRAFVELTNTSDDEVTLTDYTLRFAAHGPGAVWPGASDGTAFVLEDAALASGERAVISVSDDVRAALDASEREGVVSIFDAGGAAVDRVDFRGFPENSALSRVGEPGGHYVYCENTSPGEPNGECRALQSRAVGDHERMLATENDFRELARGRRALGIESIGVVVDMQAGDVVWFLNSGDWELHYSFIREHIELLPRLDRCDPVQRAEFNQAWVAFSQENYYRVEGRRFLLATMVRHASGLSTIEFSPGDVISPEQMEHLFFTVLKKLPDPEAWALRPQSPDQLQKMRALEGRLPIVAQDAPFRDLTFQPLTLGRAYGTLRFVPVEEIRKQALGPRDIVITDQVPNDIPLLAGLVTESFQTPLAHVNILSRGRGTPNMALRNAREDAAVLPHLDTLVRLDVEGSGFTLSPADPEEALAFWESRLPEGPPLVPASNLDVRGVVPLADRSLADLPAIGGKAAQLAELGRVVFRQNALCRGSARPENPFAVPIVHSVEHFEASAARALLEDLRKDPDFAADPVERARGLERVQARILEHPVDPELVSGVYAAISELFPGTRVRFRSSSNVEDLPGFNGAGLYQSLGDTVTEASEVEDGIRAIWASLWSLRAYDERTYYNVDQLASAMGVLIHPAFPSEAVNGVAISRDALSPTHADRYYLNVQVGEALVTNPAPGVQSEQYTFELYRSPTAVYHTQSTFSPNAHVMTEAENWNMVCSLLDIHQHFQPLIDPEGDNRWFAMDIEFKLLGEGRAPLIKQARPYSFGADVPTDWCDY
jgi:hypothetical protein